MSRRHEWEISSNSDGSYDVTRRLIRTRVVGCTIVMTLTLPKLMTTTLTVRVTAYIHRRNARIVETLPSARCPTLQRGKGLGAATQAGRLRSSLKVPPVTRPSHCQ
jgi:hypothetical protein